jgi:2-C-methyl-D-erythritol 2,4-cyclodiphosphate synthase
MNAPNFRIGEGWDVHALVPGRPLVIGGVTIPHPAGLLGHSDADVLLHALTDALLGAAGLGDIGSHFPDTDAGSRAPTPCACWPRRPPGARGRGGRWATSTAPSLRRRRAWRRTARPCASAIALAIGIDVGQVNVKAKTAEKLGPVGQGQSIEARAVALIYR